jgi:hypothetical protein
MRNVALATHEDLEGCIGCRDDGGRLGVIPHSLAVGMATSTRPRTARRGRAKCRCGDAIALSQPRPSPATDAEPLAIRLHGASIDVEVRAECRCGFAIQDSLRVGEAGLHSFGCSDRDNYSHVTKLPSEPSLSAR